ITMGCNVHCPSLPCRWREDWGIEDPVGKSWEAFRAARDQIWDKVWRLTDRIRQGEVKGNG
ncbi:MAG: arsenate reductase ArsC, partial [Negativicutes bacterium]|nr:arsenate reductase ArsC [Negativicutes bacterium]